MMRRREQLLALASSEDDHVLVYAYGDGDGSIVAAIRATFPPAVVREASIALRSGEDFIWEGVTWKLVQSPAIPSDLEVAA